MDHIDLKPYPMPDGAPRLMPFQDYPWNGDGYLAAEVLRLQNASALDYAIETGTCLGSTTLWLAHHFKHVETIEANEVFAAIARQRFSDYDTLGMTLGDSARMVGAFLNVLGSGTLCFLDAHWGQECPLLAELDAIADSGHTPCIIIHDFQVPGTDFGFDRFPGSGYPFCLEAIAPKLDAIYGAGGWAYKYPTQVEGARRGWISIWPM